MFAYQQTVFNLSSLQLECCVCQQTTGNAKPNLSENPATNTDFDLSGQQIGDLSEDRRYMGGLRELVR